MNHEKHLALAARRTQLQEHIVSVLDRVSGLAVVLLDVQGTIVAWNTGAEQMLGYSSDEAIGQPFEIFFVPEDRRSGVPQLELDTAASAGSAVDDRWHLRRDGSRFFGSGIVTACRDTDGVLLGFVDILRDLTTERRIQDQLGESEHRYRVLVNSISDHAIFMMDAAGCVSYWTPAAERIKGYTAAEIIGKPFATFFTKDDRDRGVPESELRIAREQGKAEGSGWRVRSDGSVFWADEIATAIRDASGAHVGYSKITRDNTERRRAELERERLLLEATESNRLKDEFLSTISHELRTPLNAILGWVQLMRLGQSHGSSPPDALAVIERNARAQARLIEDLLDVSRIVTGTTDLAMASVALAEPLAAAVETVRPAAEAKGVQLTVHHDLVHDELVGDAGRLQQVMWNLLSNAIKFTPAGGSVAVATCERHDGFEFTVTDSGVGIDPDFLPFVFDRFRRGDNSRSREHGGLGLGLSIVKHLVELHRGRIVVESAGRGAGTTVRVTLPRARAEHPDASTVDVPGGRLAPPPRPLDGFAVLVADDDPDARRFVELALSLHGARITGASSTAESIAAARSSRPDVILTDLSMPDEDGFELLEQLRAEPALSATPVVAITAHARAEDRARALAAGFDDYLPKPVSLSHVVEVVRRLARREHRGYPSRVGAAPPA